MKMFLEILLLITAIIILVYLSFHYAGILFAPVTQQNPQNQVCFKSRCFFVELAKTEAERDRGLMNRTELGKNKGMLFIFNKEGIYPFWMKDTLIPLDMIWIDSGNKVVFISQDVQPCRSLICPITSPSASARYVLEVNAGICQEIGLKAQDVVKININ